MDIATTNDLVSKIREANEAYRIGTPIMSDPEWDELVDELAKIDPAHELLQEVGYIAPDDSRKEQLPFPMMSMNKVKTEEEVQKWIKKNGLEKEDFVLSPKYDGNSLCAHENKMLAWTRGDGAFGQRSHEHFKAFNDTPFNEDIYTYGETIMPRARFDEKYAEDEENPRNTVGGIMNKETVTDKTYDVDYVRYGMAYEDKKLSDAFRTKSIVFDYLNERQDNNVTYHVCKADALTADNLKYLFGQWSQKYEIDGIIIEVNDLKRQEEFGRERNGNPAFARAYKGDFEEVSRRWSSPVDMLHIDGSHDYESVQRDFASWRHHLADEAILLLHDTQSYPQGPGRLFRELPYRKFEIKEHHGLGVIFISSPHFPDDFTR